MDTARRVIAAPAALALLLGSSVARAAPPACQIVNVTPMSFNVYHSGSDFPLDSVGEVDVTCTAPAAVQISLGRGISGHQIPREMRERGISLLYNLFMDAARTIVWGDGTEGTQTFTGMLPGGQTIRLPVFGRVFALQQVPSGTYVDRVIVAVIF